MRRPSPRRRRRSRAALTASGAPGVAVAVVSGDRVVWAQGFGVANVETGAPVTPDTLFQIGSATKMFTAAAMLSAASSGAVALDRPVGTLRLRAGAVRRRRRRWRSCCRTPAGVMDEPDEYRPAGRGGAGRLRAHLDQRVLPAAAGPRVLVLELGLRAGRPGAAGSRQEAVRRRDAGARARPAGDAAHDVPAHRGDDLAAGGRPSPDKEGKFTVVRPLANDARLWPAGTLYSSANEMARFAMALLNDGRVDGKPGAAGRASSRGCGPRRPRFPTTGQRYGQGLFLTGASGLRSRRHDDRLRRAVTIHPGGQARRSSC